MYVYTHRINGNDAQTAIPPHFQLTSRRNLAREWLIALDVSRKWKDPSCRNCYHEFRWCFARISVLTCFNYVVYFPILIFVQQITRDINGDEMRAILKTKHDLGEDSRSFSGVGPDGPGTPALNHCSSLMHRRIPGVTKACAAVPTSHPSWSQARGLGYHKNQVLSLTFRLEIHRRSMDFGSLAPPPWNI